MAVAVRRDGCEKRLGKELQLWAETGLSVELIPASDVVLYDACPHAARQLGLPMGGLDMRKVLEETAEGMRDLGYDAEVLPAVGMGGR